ncbi:MAG: hypothetical protein D3910_10215 [Candidatus Electrothrix sp. ATG2]|nr:hypothetical protein [Candidatus Electrothrix sp. ATG2]
MDVFSLFFQLRFNSLKKAENNFLDFILTYVHYIQFRVDIIIRTRYTLFIFLRRITGKVVLILSP